jgi:protoporphyrinogen oxidase
MKRAIIIGAGPAGITAAYELATKTGIKPIIFEQQSQSGGLAKTVEHKGYKIDIGPHRFFTKSAQVQKLWEEVLGDELLTIKRLTRILYEGNFYNYPITLSWSTIKNLGFWRLLKIGFSYLKIRLRPLKEEKNLEDFFINRFGYELYKTFFKDYTEKIWGYPCQAISDEWGSQRIKGLSITKIIKNIFKNLFFSKKSKKVETSLIEEFFYPKYGAGYFYGKLLNLAQNKGAEIYYNHQVVGLQTDNNKITAVKIKTPDGRIITEELDYLISSMPIQDLVAGFGQEIAKEIKDTAAGLVYRDYIIVGLILKSMQVKNEADLKNKILPDNWLYIQENDYKIGRLDVFNNFSPDLLADKNNILLGAEYFCQQNDDFWQQADEEIKSFAVNELKKLGFIAEQDIVDWFVIRVPKAYPAYINTYGQFNIIKNFLDGFENLFLCVRYKVE